MLQRIRWAEGVVLAGVILLGACDRAAPVPDTAAESETARFNTDVDGDGVNDVRIGYGETAEAETSAKPADHDHDHDHDHDDSSGAGVAHVHGVGVLAMTIENATVSAQMISPLANFGLSEAEGVFSEEVIAALPALVSLTGGDCQATPPVAAIDRSSGHTDADITFAWTCAKPDRITSVRFDGFTAFPGFEKVSVIMQNGADQRAGEVTPSKPALSLK